tara:strand:- start:355 stop:852 length:498 start_codon:yes stop_codon:yes gene_type:complete
MLKKNYILSIDINNQCVEDTPDHETFEEWFDCALVNLNHHLTFEYRLFELSLKIVNANEIKILNDKFRQNNKVTNVLSFPSKMSDLIVWPDDQAYHLGDIVICPSKLNTEAYEQKKSNQSHWCHLAIHGFLHLFDYDHIDDKDAKKMEDLEILICSKLGFSDPYK